MIANYHTHTHRCNHAIGREEDYVKEALKAGLKILGWADHTPYLFTGGYYSTFRMRPIQLPGYVKTIQELRENGMGRENIPAMMAAVVVISVPLIVLFLIFRKKIMAGVSRGGVKG